ncbi:hypothetical protein LEP1GSC188_1151 [Leptospira weilii serovar Topaz str. LT2116]|uniref:Uncharacterized protein n=1 Tax=Leptospira weilii serovar Topaz str. LT2116 TaxID=1088540 RepID=M3FT84_9LEPT|nr:hypothetical protein LEP1GSC188_1151 [Leptospira weilii serovar Topaz str. LT2116]
MIERAHQFRPKVLMDGDRIHPPFFLITSPASISQIISKPNI